jgi:TIR domain
MGRAIFISYRRDDTEGEAGRLFDDLVRAFGDDSVFMDVAGINPGIDFRKAIDDNVATCGVLLAMIGPRWTTVTNSSGKARLEDDNDFVRLEIASALARNVAVIPVLVHDAKMPPPDDLPENLKDLAFRNSVEITHARWNSDVQLLTKALRQYVASPSAADTEPVHAAVPVQLPAPNAPSANLDVRHGSKTALIAGITTAVVLLIAIIGFVAWRNSRDHGREPIPGKTEASALAGTWVTPSAGGRNDLARLHISAAGDQVAIHASGGCAGCDWGTQNALYDGKATATWTFVQPMGGDAPGRTATVTIARAGDQLAVTVVNTFPGRKPNERALVFSRAAVGVKD